MKIKSTKWRVAVSLVAWLTSAFALFISAMSIYSASGLIAGNAESLFVVFTFVLFGYPWIALAVMNWAWVKNRKAHWWWGVTGSLSGLASVSFSFGMGLLLAPLAVLLAIYLVYVHATSDGLDTLKK